MEKFQQYISAVDGNNDWKVIGPLFDDAFEDDCVFITADGQYDKAAWAETAKGLVAKGGVASGFEILTEEGDQVTYQATVTIGDDPIHMSARGTLRDGRLVKVEPVDPAVYSELVERGR